MFNELLVRSKRKHSNESSQCPSYSVLDTLKRGFRIASQKFTIHTQLTAKQNYVSKIPILF